MADPICRWRNPYIRTVIELINLLPKSEMTQEQARLKVMERSPYDFYRTPYQLACQLGLYHETNGRYFPKFNYLPTEEELQLYLQNWIIHYCVPNPYTRGFEENSPFSIHGEVCRILQMNQSPTSWDVIRDTIFGNQIGNNDILVNSINSYSPIIVIREGIVQLKEDLTYLDLSQYIEVDINSDRNNKEYFFDLFPIPSKNLDGDQNHDIIQQINPQEVELINQIQNLPNISQTQKNQIVAARIGQGYFRRGLILETGICPISGVDETTLLIASHIKPWKLSTNLERINPKNGFLFTPTFDKLFDKGYITFTNDRRLLISNILSNENRNRLNLENNNIHPLLPIEGREEFLEFHRDNIFIQ